MKRLISSLETKARSHPLLQSIGGNPSSAAASDAGDASPERRREQDAPSLPAPDVAYPFPVIEQPPRCILALLNSERRLTVTRNGAAQLTPSRGEREQFMLIPADRAAADDAAGDAADSDADRNPSAGELVGSASNAASDGSKSDENVFYLRSYKSNRYLTTNRYLTNRVSTIDPTKSGDEDGEDGQRSVKVPGAAEEWRLTRSPHGGHFIVSAKRGLNLACHHGDGDAPTSVGLGDKNDQSESWEVEFVSGELCFLSSPPSTSPGEDVGRRIRCDLMGKLSLTSDERGWEVWRFVEMGGGTLRIVSWMHSQFCIACSHDGEISTARIGGVEEGCDAWTVEKAPGGYSGVVIKSVACARRILSRGSEGEADLTATQELEGPAGIWQLGAAHSQTYTLTSFDGSRSITFPFVTENVKQNDHLILQQIDEEGTVRFYHKSRGQYLRSRVAGEVSCDPMLPHDEDASALWKMRQTAAGGRYTFSSGEHGGLLAFTDGTSPHRTLCTVPAATGDGRVAWNVNPILPRAISSSKIKAFAIGTSVAVGTTVAMPFLMAGMLAAVPAEATLAASILGAGLTGAEAIASVGAIGVTAAIVFREAGDTLGIEAEGGGGEDYTRRPLCAWRTW